ncbi:MAG TPA: TIM barrel protein [Stellaceae bacterium]|jgi:sugar phosphate isomerase/epimerase|nr:TIM barrel protein [Stellaceae bacterium]
MISLAPLTVNEAGPLDLIAAAAAGGFDAVDLRVIGPPGVAAVPPITDALAADIRRRLTDNGITAFSATGIWLAPDFAVASVESALATAAGLDASHCLAAGYDADWPRLTDNFAALCQSATRYRLHIALEFMPYIPLNDIHEAVRLLRDANQPNAGLVIDALHLMRSGGMPSDVAAIPRERIAYVQLCDGPRLKPVGLALREESLRHRLYPGDGEFPLFDLMDALPPDFTIDLETPCAADAHLPFDERARRAGDATRRFLAAYRAR